MKTVRTAVSHGFKSSCFIISGGPGSGKSTLLNALSASGEICYEEASRVLIREQLARNGRRVPWRDLRGFADDCSARMRLQLSDSARHERAFVDRGLPDLIGYLNRSRLAAPSDWREAARGYASIVFFAPPWRGIYINDPERPQSFSEAQELSRYIAQAYLDCGFQLIPLIKSSTADRVHQVLTQLNALDECSRLG